MKTAQQTRFFIWQLARVLHENEATMSVAELAAVLNRSGFRTQYGTEYAGERGSYTLVSAVYDWLSKQCGLGDEAEKVARAFPSSDGSYAYEHASA